MPRRRAVREAAGEEDAARGDEEAGEAVPLRDGVPEQVQDGARQEEAHDAGHDEDQGRGQDGPLRDHGAGGAEPLRHSGRQRPPRRQREVRDTIS